MNNNVTCDFFFSLFNWSFCGMLREKKVHFYSTVHHATLRQYVLIRNVPAICRWFSGFFFGRIFIFSSCTVFTCRCSLLVHDFIFWPIFFALVWVFIFANFHCGGKFLPRNHVWHPSSPSSPSLDVIGTLDAVWKHFDFVELLLLFLFANEFHPLSNLAANNHDWYSTKSRDTLAKWKTDSHPLPFSIPTPPGVAFQSQLRCIA